MSCASFQPILTHGGVHRPPFMGMGARFLRGVFALLIAALWARAQKAPESQREQILKAITGEQLTGDLLTASIWGYFAAMQSHGTIAASQAKMIDLPALSYGLFHAQVRPNKLYGLIATGITMEGLNIDVGHLRHIRWTIDDNPQSEINNKPELTQNGRTAAHNRWIAYNKMRGQYGSAMEHAIPEQFWVDKNKCSYLDDKGQLKNPNLQPCAEAISAVKAIAIAQSEGQKIYTINKDNAATALPKLTGISAEIRSAIEAGKEVSFHEKAISAHGWSGQGYIIVAPETGAGAYLIEGKGNGGVLAGVIYATLVAIAITAMFMPLLVVLLAMLSEIITIFGAVILATSVSMALLVASAEMFLQDSPCIKASIQLAAITMLSIIPWTASPYGAAFVTFSSLGVLMPTFVSSIPVIFACFGFSG